MALLCAHRVDFPLTSCKEKKDDFLFLVSREQAALNYPRLYHTSIIIVTPPFVLVTVLLNCNNLITLGYSLEIISEISLRIS